MNLRSIFINEYGRVRSGWRSMIFLALFFGLLATISVPMFFVYLSFKGLPGETPIPVLFLESLTSLLTAVLIGWLCGRYLEGLPFRALGCWFSNGWLKHLAFGLAVGAVTIGIAVLIASGFGGLAFTPDLTNTETAIVKTLGVSLAVFAVAAAFEEALFRGYILQTLNRSGLGWLAIALTAIFFGLAHLGNRDANVISTANTMLAGIWFGVAYLKTRDLWFPFGIHLVWNWLQGSIFGIEVSGLTEVSPAPVLSEIDRGPAWLTGEHYGIEASIACTIAILISIALIRFLPGIRPSEEMVAMTGTETPRLTT